MTKQGVEFHNVWLPSPWHVSNAMKTNNYLHKRKDAKHCIDASGVEYVEVRQSAVVGQMIQKKAMLGLIVNTY